MDYVMQGRIHDFVVASLRELGVAHPRLNVVNMRVLTQDGFYAGQVVQCEHIRVFFSADGQNIHFFGPGGMLLKQVPITKIAA
jgi:hypothetical protein